MKIKDIKPFNPVFEIIVKVVDVSEIRKVNTKNGEKMVCDYTVEDDSGSIMLTAWGDDIDKLVMNKTYKIMGTYAKEWKDTLQLSMGKFSKVEDYDTDKPN